MTKLTPTQDVKRRLLAGETLTSEQVQQDYDVSKALLHSVLKKVQDVDGWTVAKERTGNGGRTDLTRYRLVSPAPDVDEKAWGPDPAARSLQADVTAQRRKADRERKRLERAQAKLDKGHAPRAAHGPKSNGSAVARVNGQALTLPGRTKVNGAGPIGHPVPALGDGLQVYLLMLDDDGSVRVGLRNGEAAWLTSVDGFAARET